MMHLIITSLIVSRFFVLPVVLLYLLCVTNHCHTVRCLPTPW